MTNIKGNIRKKYPKELSSYSCLWALYTDLPHGLQLAFDELGRAQCERREEGCQEARGRVAERWQLLYIL